MHSLSVNYVKNQTGLAAWRRWTLCAVLPLVLVWLSAGRATGQEKSRQDKVAAESGFVPDESPDPEVNLEPLPEDAGPEEAESASNGNTAATTLGDTPEIVEAPAVVIGDDWFSQFKVGYDDAFVIASGQESDLDTSDLPFKLRINGWGQLRHTVFNANDPDRELNELQLKRGRLIFSGSAYTPDFTYFVQLDGRSTSGDSIRLLDYNLGYDLGHDVLGMNKGKLGIRAGRFKIPFTLSRFLTSQEFQFADRSMASTFFDVNRSLAWELFGKINRGRKPIYWRTAIFNGLVTGGAETGSTGSLDTNFGYSARFFSYPIGDWGIDGLADLQWHERPAMRVGIGFANSSIDGIGTTEFDSLRVVDSGAILSSLLPDSVTRYEVSSWAVDTSFKYRGWSTTFEYYFRTTGGFVGADIPELFDHGFWLQFGKFVIPQRLELTTRWSRVVGESGTLGVMDQSSDELAAGFVYYFRNRKTRFTLDATHLDGAPISSPSLDVSPGDAGWLVRSQVQFSF